MRARREDILKRGVGVVRDKELRPADGEASRTPGGTGEVGAEGEGS